MIPPPMAPPALPPQAGRWMPPRWSGWERWACPCTRRLARGPCAGRPRLPRARCCSRDVLACAAPRRPPPATFTVAPPSPSPSLLLLPPSIALSGSSSSCTNDTCTYSFLHHRACSAASDIQCKRTPTAPPAALAQGSNAQQPGLLLVVLCATAWCAQCSVAVKLAHSACAAWHALGVAAAAGSARQQVATPSVRRCGLFVLQRLIQLV